VNETPFGTCHGKGHASWESHYLTPLCVGWRADDDSLDPDALNEAAMQVCLNRSDDWQDADERANAIDDARTAIEIYIESVPPVVNPTSALRVVAAARSFSHTEAKINLTSIVEEVIRDAKAGTLDLDPGQRAEWAVTIGLRNSAEWHELVVALAVHDGFDLDDVGEPSFGDPS
jgi:hypothetical protein